MSKTLIDISKCIEIYKNQLAEGNIQAAYNALTKYVAELKTKFPKEYTAGKVSFGYLDYTYFPFFNEYLRDKKLRFDIVLNHEKMRFELWLMGRNAPVQIEYWEISKDTEWNENINSMPKYSILEVCIEDKIDFNDKDNMTRIILGKTISIALEIQTFLKKINETSFNLKVTLLKGAVILLLPRIFLRLFVDHARCGSNTDAVYRRKKLRWHHQCGSPMLTAIFLP